MADLIVAVILLVIVGASVRYIIKAKKSGAKCIGCPLDGGCGGKCSCGCADTESAADDE